MRYMLKTGIAIAFITFITVAVTAQTRPAMPAGAPGGMPTGMTKPASDSAAPKAGPKPYRKVITEKAITTKGLITVHKVEDKYYFEIADSIMNREILAVTRYIKLPWGGGNYGGEEANENVLRFEKGPDNKIFLRVSMNVVMSPDSTQPIYQAVSNSAEDPIAAAFEIKAFGKDSASSVIDVTDFFKGDNQIVSLDPGTKRQFSITAISPDRSYISSMKSYPINTEIRSVKTFGTSSAPFTPGQPQAGPRIPAAQAAGAITIELNTSLLLLPREPMMPRKFDPRVGFFADRYTIFEENSQKSDENTFITRWRLEPKDEDIEKYKRGELVEPKKQIVYYIDPATPKQWRKYLIAGINDWQAAFEKAGFKNAIVGKEWPENDPNMSLEDARFSVIRYFASDIQNAYGPNVHDPRSGEILESHIGWYHNVMKLVHDWYMLQTAAVDPRARKMVYDEELMGQLIRFVSSHEVGHTLGLRHNMSSSNKTPVENLRNKAWVEANGHTSSIMDYARFNYVAQPEDNISPAGLYPRIGDYDKWAIQWGYKLSDAKNEEDDAKITNKWFLDNVPKNPRLTFGGEGRNNDPRAQTEDLGDNNMKASEYGIKNLKRIIVNLPEWTKEEGDKYENLSNMYNQLVIQFNRYMNHVAKNIGGVEETPRSIEEKEDVYAVTAKATQKEAVAFLQKQLFETPTWLLDKNILNKVSNPASNENIQTVQNNVLSGLFSAARLARMSSGNNRDANAYSPDELITDVKKGVFSELATKKPIDYYRRNLQKTFAESLMALLSTAPAAAPTSSFGGPVAPLDTKRSDLPSIARGQLMALQNEIRLAIPATTDKLSKYHLQDLNERIRQALSPK